MEEEDYSCGEACCTGSTEEELQESYNTYLASLR